MTRNFTRRMPQRPSSGFCLSLIPVRSVDPDPVRSVARSSCAMLRSFHNKTGTLAAHRVLQMSCLTVRWSGHVSRFGQ